MVFLVLISSFVLRSCSFILINVVLTKLISWLWLNNNLRLVLQYFYLLYEEWGKKSWIQIQRTNTSSKICRSRKPYTGNKINSFHYPKVSNTESKSQFINHHFLHPRLIINLFEMIILIRSPLKHTIQIIVHGGKKYFNATVMNQLHLISRIVIIVRDVFIENNKTLMMMINPMWVNNEWKGELNNQSPSSMINSRATN